MPIVKYIAIHVSPKAMIEYILNGDKNAEMKYVTGIHTLADAELSFNLFKLNFELYSYAKFQVSNLDMTKKQKIRLHHYIQSFDPKDNITPEKAHEIGVEWARKAFGGDRQILCSTHIDKDHIHNHFAVAVYSNSGVKWNANYTTLNKARDISDQVCKKYNIGIIVNPDKHSSIKRKEWVEMKNNNSWKFNVRSDIDKLITDESIYTLEHLLSKLKSMGYTVRHGKFITVQPPGIDRGVRTYRLGVGYSEQDLIYRIVNKDKEYTIEAIMNQYKGIHLDFALCLHKIQCIVYHKLDNPKRYTVRDVQQIGETLIFLRNNNIFSKEQLTDYLNTTSDKLTKVEDKCNKANIQVNEYKTAKKDFEIYTEICNKLPDLTEQEQSEYVRTQYVKNYTPKRLQYILSVAEDELSVLEKEKEKLFAEKNKTEAMLIQYEKYMQDDFSTMLDKIRKEREQYSKITQSEKNTRITQKRPAYYEYDR